MRTRWFGRCALGLVTLAAACPVAVLSESPGRPVEFAETARGIAARVCGTSDSKQWFSELPSDGEFTVSSIVVRAVEVGERARWSLGNRVWTAERFAPSGRLHRVHVRLDQRTQDSNRAELLVMANQSCVVTGGRRLRYANAVPPVALDYLDARLIPTGVSEPLNPPVPSGDDSGGLRVALVDSGVNYLLPEISHALARDQDGRILGYDFWDMDRRPFDTHLVSSPFFPRRHGTRTASLLRTEAPLASLLPFRYPRPDMSRMAELVDEAAANGARIVNLSLGSDDLGEWQAFAAAAARHGNILFVASAGNDGLDIDSDPVYPASLALENLIVATSAGRDRLPASGSNWGKQSVDLLVPAEQMIVTGFDGHARFASGSSYAAVRISALAACLLGAHPHWGAIELKRELFSLAEADVDVLRFVAQGFLPNPVEHARGICQADPDHVEVELTPAMEPTSPASRGSYILAPSFAMLQGAGWDREHVYAAIEYALSLFSACGIVAAPAALHVVSGPRRLRYYHRSTAAELVQATAMPSPNVFFVKDSLTRERFDAHSFGSLNSGNASWLMNTVWVMSGARDVGVALAHELYHVLADSGEHSEDKTNLMHAETSPTGVLLTQEQCMRLTERGSARGLLQRRE